MSSVLDLRLLQHFTVVYRLGSFSKAASEVGLSQSALTKRVQQLESDLGVALFLRTTRSVTPTEAGRRLYRRALDLLAQAETVRESALGGNAALKIVTGPHAFAQKMTAAVMAFRAQFPDRRIIARTMPPNLAIEELIQQRAHILMYHAVVIDSLPHAHRISVRKLAREPYAVVCRRGHPVLATKQSIMDLLDYDFALPAHEPAAQEFLWTSDLPEPLRVKLVGSNFPKYRLANVETCLQLAASSDILTVVPKITAQTFQTHHPIIMIDGYEDMLSTSYGVATLQETSQEPVIKAFIDAVENNTPQPACEPGDLKT